MSVYTRHFQVPESSALVSKMLEITAREKDYIRRCNELATKYGAERPMYYSGTGALAGFRFADMPDQRAWRKPDSDRLYWPRLSSKEGKAIAAEIKALGKAPCSREIFEDVGLGDGRMLLLEGMRMHGAGLFFMAEPFTFFITIPWRDEDPEVLEQYKRDREAGTHFDSCKSYLLWTAPEDWLEVKEWQMKKAIDEAKEAAHD